MKIMTANEARNESESFDKLVLDYTLTEINRIIKETARGGKKSIDIFIPTHAVKYLQLIKRELESLGYKVSISKDLKISWE